MIEHARVVLLRPSPAGFELLLVRRGDATNFPGGGIHEGEDARVGAVRTVFEDCGVLLARDSGSAAETLEMPSFGMLRRKIRAGANATQVLRENGLTWASEALLPWSQWLTPAVEGERSSTRIYIAELPGGMRTTFDKTENAHELWLSPADADALAGEHSLSPMLVRTCWELARHVDVKAVRDAARMRASEQHPILPRLSAREGSHCVLLPWDPEYEKAGQGESHPLTYQPSWAVGPSRFVLEDRTWKHVAAPGSTTAG